MKLLGHAWVAVNAYPEGDRRLLILGSILPEIMYYTKNHPFKFEEIHEGGDLVYEYLKVKNPQLADLGLGMLAHSVKAGADKFNLDENLSILGYGGVRLDKLRNDLCDILGVSYETAKTRAHNILELAVELNIIKKNPSFTTDFNRAIADWKLRESIELTLSDCFKRSRVLVTRVVNELFNKAKADYFKDADGLASLWAELSKDFDPDPDKEGLSQLLTDLSESFSGKDEVFLKECIEWTKGNLEKRR